MELSPVKMIPHHVYWIEGDPDAEEPSYIGKFEKVVTREQAKEQGLLTSDAIQGERLVHFSNVVEVVDGTPVSQKVYGNTYSFYEPEPYYLKKYQRFMDETHPSKTTIRPVVRSHEFTNASHYPTKIIYTIKSDKGVIHYGAKKRPTRRRPTQKRKRRSKSRSQR